MANRVIWSRIGVLAFCATLVSFAAGCDDAPAPVGAGSDTPGDVVVHASPLVNGGRFGSWCTRSYQNNWQVEQPQAWDLCGGFVSQMDVTAAKVFYFDLNNKKFFWEKDGDHQAANNSADDVDLLWVATHGGVDSTTAVYAMWNDDVTANSSAMRLGDSATWGGGLAILATYACDVLTNSDNKLVQRWAPALRGGLKMVLGSHATLNGGDTTDDCGANFADLLQHGYSVRTSWRDGMIDWYVDQDPAIMATGSTCSDCTNRRDGMTWANFGNFPFIRDNNIGCTCWWTWDNL
jgi:hypothetical protein